MTNEPMWLLLGWPFVGVALSLAVLGWLLLRPMPGPWAARLRDPHWLIWLYAPVYAIHQFEEHGYDIFGRRFHFQVSLCQQLGFAEPMGCPADGAFILAVNVPAIWFAGLLATRMLPGREMAGMALWSLPFANTFAHLVPWIRSGHYNPGVVTSILLFLPLSLWAFRCFWRAGLLDGPRLAVALITGFVQHAILLGSLQGVIHGTYGHGLLNGIQLLNAGLPLLLGVLVKPANRSPQP